MHPVHPVVTLAFMLIIIIKSKHLNACPAHSHVHSLCSSVFTFRSLRPPRSTVCTLYSLQYLQSSLYAVCSLSFLQYVPSFFTLFALQSSLSAVFLLHSSLHSSHSAPSKLYTLVSLLLPPLSRLSTLSALHVCLPCSDLQVLGHVACCTLCIGCGSSSLSASSSRFTFVASKLGPAQLLNSLSCSTADSCCPPECTPTLPCAAGRHFDPIHLAHLSKKEKKKHLFCSSSSSSLSTSPSPCLLYFR